ncbi:MAG: hypothetical protein JWQ07_4375 [Ramlibacter sp.]|nr:hypothetical protein [Ramlibacter sp.]
MLVRLGLLALALLALQAHAQCPPAGETLASLQGLKARGWNAPRLEAPAARQALAIGLLDCLREPSPQLRDELAFDGLQAMMRGGQLDVPTLQSLRTRLLATLAEPADAVGFAQPFSALVLAEVVRADRQRPFLLPAERDEVVERAAAWLAGVRDYRGFDQREGWRHAVAHGADLMVQLAVHPLLQRTQAETILAAIAAQVTPPAEHFYHYGEAERLMAPVFYLARRGWFSAGDWDTWLSLLVSRLPPPEPMTQIGLAARHNLSAFFQALYVSVQETGNDEVKKALLPGLSNAIKAVG